VLTVQEEWMFVWGRRPWLMFPKALYVIIRYFSILSASIRWVYLEYHACHLGEISGWLAVINFTAINLVLIMRVWILYNLSRMFSIVIVVASLVFLGAALAIRAYPPRVPLPFVEAPPVSLMICPRSEPQE